jgi:aminoglycoside phosphotransferase (APT) family kinase protein
MSAALADFVAQQEGLAPGRVRVEGLGRLVGGSSRLMWSADVELERAAGTERREVVLRQDPPGRIVPGRMGLEFDLLVAAAAAGVPVPRVYWCDPTPQHLGAPFFAMQRLSAETIPRRLLRDERYADARARLCDQLARALAAIHAIDLGPSALGQALEAPEPPASAAESEIRKTADGYRMLALEPHPVLDLAERWLLAHAPATDRLHLVHGDFRLGNFMFDESGLVAVLDWELAHWGDPVEDLAWLCVRAWRFGSHDLPAAGLASREALVASYQAAGGAPVDFEALRFWEVLGNFKLALVFIGQARAYLDGAHATVDLAALGRRIAEPEAELLVLLEQAG